MGWFRRRQPATHEPHPFHADRAFAHGWGFTLDEWADLSEHSRAEYRAGITHAPNLHTRP